MVVDFFSQSRVWFITGSSQGLGRALLEQVLVAGERAVATLRTPATLAALAHKYPPSQLLVIPLDVTVPAQVENAFEATRKHFGRLDVVVNNAGYAVEGEIEGISEDDARKQMEVLFWGPVHISKEAAKFMRKVNPPGHGGLVLNVSSLCGYSSNPTLAYYCAGKFALEAFTESFTKEMLPEWNIKSVIIEPGGFRTKWNGDSMVRRPVHPDYDNPDAPTVVFRRMMKQEFVGDPVRGAKAMIRIAGMTNPPLRIQLGTDSLMFVRHKALKTIEDGAILAELAHSTNADGVDRAAVVQQFKELE